MAASRHSPLIVGTVFFLTLLLPESTQADVFAVGDRRINVPAPQGFAVLTEDMSDIVPLLLEFTHDPYNDTLAVYIPETTVPTVMAGAVPPLDRWFILKVNTRFRTVTVGRDDFARLKDTLRNDLRNMLPEIRSRLSDMEATRNRELGVMLETTQIALLDPHFEDDNAIAYSMFMTQTAGLDATPGSSICSTTHVTLNAAGAILSLYSYGTEDDLEWTRDTARLWANSVIASNDPPPSASPREQTIDWSRVALRAIVGGLAGGVVALILRLRSVRRKQGAA